MMEKGRNLTHVESKQYDESDEVCGWGPLRPPICQNLRSMKLVLLFLSIGGFIQGMVVNGFINVVASSIERRFTLLSQHSGIIMSCYDIASVVCTIPVSYVGTDFHKPRLLGAGLFIVGLGAFVFSLPHFMTGTYEYEVSSHAYKCVLSANQSENEKGCEGRKEMSYLSNYRYMFMLAQFLHGAGATPVFTIGITYLDDNLPTHMTSVYIAIFYSMAMLGAAVGYLIESKLLLTFCDFDKVDVSIVTITTDSPSWVGAWWIGFLVAGLITVCISFPMMGFPKVMPGWELLKVKRKNEAYGGDQCPNSTDTTTTKGIIHAFIVLFTNPVFMLLSLAAAAEGIVLVGYWSFAPKFIESQFSLSASMAALVVGCTAVPAGAVGLLMGGYLQKKLDLSVVGLLRLCLILNFISILFLFTFYIRCPEVHFAGLSAPYDSAPKLETNEYALESSCNADCQCNKDNYYPVCGKDNLTYFSPCLAGCLDEFKYDSNKFFNTCACINSNLPSGHDAKEGKCPVDCNMLVFFMALFAVFIGVTLMTMIPGVMATLRCVPDRERSMGIGLNWIIIRCLGTIPAPIFFGIAIDRSCRLWKMSCDGDDGKLCLFYNNYLMSDYVMAIGFTCKCTAFILFVFAYLLYKRFADLRANRLSCTDQQRGERAKNETHKAIPVAGAEIHTCLEADGESNKSVPVTTKTYKEIDPKDVEIET